MDEDSSSPTNPYAMLHRGQSKRAPNIPVGDGLAAIMSRKTEAPPYEDLINFPRAKDKDEIRCVMCGLPPGPGCVIPRQNKDVCKECDKSTWQHCASSVYFKWCKGCKKFLRLGSFSEKLDAAKCDRCRERGRQSYLLKKGKDGECPRLSTGGSRSRSCSITSTGSDGNDIHELDLAAAAAAIAAVAARRGGGSSCSVRDVREAQRDMHDHHHHHTAVSSSGEDEDRELEGMSASPYSDCDDDAGVRAVRALRAGSNASPGFDENDGDHDGGMSYRTPGGPGSGLSGNSGYDHLSAGLEEPVVIDDDTADVTKSKLSSIFGKPLKALKRQAPRTDDEDLAVKREGSDGNESSGESTSSGEGGVSAQLRGTLYELACIHQRIMTLEEHAAKVQELEARVKSQEGQIDQMRVESTQLQEQVAASKLSEEGSQRDAERLRMECVALRERQSAFEMREAELTQRLSESDALSALSCVMERVQKRPRLVSLGE